MTSINRHKKLPILAVAVAKGGERGGGGLINVGGVKPW